MSDIAGSIRKLILDGITFDVPADANISEVGGGFESESIPTSGRNMHKMTRRPENRESVVVMANGAERDLLKTLSERTDDFTMSYTTAGGDVYRCSGWIEFEARETEENRATIQLHPRTTWDAFVAT